MELLVVTCTLKYQVLHMTVICARPEAVSDGRVAAAATSGAIFCFIANFNTDYRREDVSFTDCDHLERQVCERLKNDYSILLQ